MAVSSFVESVEFIEATLPAASTYIDVPLTKGQDYTNCVPFVTNTASTGEWVDSVLSYKFIGTTESGIMRFQRTSASSVDLEITFYIIEFNSILISYVF